MYTPEPQNIWQEIEYSALGDYIATSIWAFPTIETLHVIALVTVFGAIAIMDLRLLGLASKESRVSEISDNTIPIVWGAFALAAITGTLLFIGKTSSYVVNPFFLWKMFLIVLAGINMAIFQFGIYKSVDQWDTAADIPFAAKLAGGLSLAFWITIVFLGRAIGFTLYMYFME